MPTRELAVVRAVRPMVEIRLFVVRLLVEDEEDKGVNTPDDPEDNDDRCSPPVEILDTRLKVLFMRPSERLFSFSWAYPIRRSSSSFRFASSSAAARAEETAVSTRRNASSVESLRSTSGIMEDMTLYSQKNNHKN